MKQRSSGDFCELIDEVQSIFHHAIFHAHAIGKSIKVTDTNK